MENNELKKSDWRILVVDDTPTNLSVLKGTLEPEGYKLAFASSGEETLEITPELMPDLILLDVMMSGIDGFETCRRLKEDPETNSIPIIFITAKKETEDIVEGLKVGGVDYIPKPFQQEEVSARVQNHLEIVNLKNSLQLQYLETKEILKETLSGGISILMEMLSNFDPKLFSRGVKVRELVRTFAPRWKLEESWQIELAAMLGPIGYITIPPEIMAKSRRGAMLTVKEVELIRNVPKASSQILENIPRLKEVAKIVLYQKKNYDGSGYPHGSVEGQSIPFEARILCLLSGLVELEEEKNPRVKAVEMLNKKRHLYDPELLKSLQDLIREDKKEKVDEDQQPKSKAIKFAELKVGHVLAEKIESKDDLVLLSAGQTVSKVKLMLLSNHHKIVGIKEPIYIES